MRHSPACHARHASERSILGRCVLPSVSSVSPHGEPQRMKGQASIRLAFVHAHGTTAARVRLCKVKGNHRQLHGAVTSTQFLTASTLADSTYIQLCPRQQVSAAGNMDKPASLISLWSMNHQSVNRGPLVFRVFLRRGSHGWKSLPDQPSRQRGAKMKISGAISFCS